MSEIKVNSIKGVGASAAAVTVHNSDGTCTLSSGSKLNNCTTDGTTNLTIADGNLVVGTSGHGIDFSATSQGAGMSSELLDSYEEGTWNPIWSDAAAASGGTTTSNNMFGSYTRIGRVVHAHFFTWGLPVQGTSNSMYLQGFPFAMAAGTNATFCAVQTAYYNFGADNYYNLGLRMTNGNTWAPLVFSRQNSGDQISASFSGFINYYTNFSGCMTYIAV